MNKKTEKGLLIGSLVFWIVLLVFSYVEYESLDFNFKSPTMIAFGLGSMLTAMQWLFCAGLPAGATKHREKWFIPTKKGNISPKQLKEHRKQAAIIAVIWIVFLACEWTAIYFNVVDQRFVIFGMIILRIIDRLFVLTWCPFGVIMQNRCCTECRIYGWDQLMLVSPMIFYPTEYTLILIALAAIPFVEWEFAHWKHPERFFSSTNEGITCKHCNGVCGRCKKIGRA